LKRRELPLCALALAMPVKGAEQPPSQQDALRIPLREGLMIVSAVNNGGADFESIKRVTRIDASGVHVTYAAEAATVGNRAQRVEVGRTILLADLEAAHDYQWGFFPGTAQTYPGSTAIGVSAGVLDELHRLGQTRLRTPRGVDAGMLDGSVVRVGRGAVAFKVIVNDLPVDLPAVHARGRLGGQAAELWILDDRLNPLALRWTIGERRLQVIRLSFPPEKSSPSARIERALANDGRAPVYGIRFGFESDRIQDESEPVLREIAMALEQNPGLSLGLEGHTDNIGSDPSNLELSMRRAAAVKKALVERYQVDARRLRAIGYGASRPKDTNDTLEGRARNRRVELVKE
jgi:OOP family OmpA-OmpF porin